MCLSCNEARCLSVVTAGPSWDMSQDSGKYGLKMVQKVRTIYLTNCSISECHLATDKLPPICLSLEVCCMFITINIRWLAQWRRSCIMNNPSKESDCKDRSSNWFWRTARHLWFDLSFYGQHTATSNSPSCILLWKLAHSLQILVICASVLWSCNSQRLSQPWLELPCLASWI